MWKMEMEAAAALVVPAKAGTHTPRPEFVGKKDHDLCAKQFPLVVMGPGLRRDDQAVSPSLHRRIHPADHIGCGEMFQRNAAHLGCLALALRNRDHEIAAAGHRDADGGAP